MTTAYTTTQNITTPSTVLTDFTLTVPAPSQASIGINAYGSGTGADINTFDIGPCGDSCVILETLAAGGHHIHDGVIHDSRTPAWADPSIGVHGIYDKSNGTLVENIEFYNHPAGEAYSARYGNTCFSCVFHDTPYSIGLFNYQGAALGPAGALQIRGNVFYNLPSGGYVFYSDGTWKESNGTLLGNSLISVEIDHCTIDIRGVVNPFNFHDCHNDVYLTNCVIISDSGLPLSSIIVPPVDGSTVHLDGSIVLSSADAATYLGPAPTFTPIAVGGSPVIGTAVASPPATFAQFGNAGDVGATQSGSPAPGPPPLPGPSVPDAGPAVVVGEAGAGSTDTLVIPITVDVPRTDPTLGATFVFVFFQLDVDSTSTVISVSDDAAVEDDYSLCVFADGLNHYDPAGPPAVGLIVNPLENGVHNITITLDSPTGFIQAAAVAVTGIGAPGGWPALPADPGMTWWTTILSQAQAPVGGGTSVASGIQWDYDAGNNVVMVQPTGTTDTDWDWIDGTLAVYWVAHLFAGFNPDPIDWTWTDASISDLIQWDIDSGIGAAPYMLYAIATAPITPGAAGPTLAGSIGSGGSIQTVGGSGMALKGGPGPNCTTPPPPGTGVPIFNNHIRLSE